MRAGKAPFRKPRPAARRALPVVHVLVALAVVGGSAFYAGYRFGLGRAERGSDETRAEREPHDATKGRTTAERPPPRGDVHFQPTTVTARTGNFLANAGFEEGEAGWKWLDWSSQWGKFEVAQARVATGAWAAHLAVHGGPADSRTRVFGVVQELVSPVFPTRISGRYFVERWEPGVARRAYVQLAILAMKPTRNASTMQLRYILDGVTEEPYHLSNAHYVFVRRRERPETGVWIDFALDVREDYRRLWGEVPPDGTGYRVLFEARYDDKPPGATVAIDVWYDDLFAGVP